MSTELISSWADQVEQEHMAAGRVGLSRQDSVQDLPPNGGGRKSKNRKKKKNCKKGTVVLDKDECDRTKHLDAYVRNCSVAEAPGTALGKAKGAAVEKARDVVNKVNQRVTADSHAYIHGVESNNSWGSKGNGLHVDSFSNPAQGGWANSVNETDSNVIQSWRWAATRNLVESSTGNQDRNDTKNNFTSTEIFSLLLPSEKQAVPGMLIHSVDNADSIERERGSLQGDGPFVLDDYPSSVHSDSMCSDDDLDSDDDYLGSEDFESDVSDESINTRKKNKWFLSFFQTLDALTNDQLEEHDRQWHCPACRGGVGAIDWYRGLQPLLAHAKTLRSKRVKLHQKFAKVLELDLIRRGAGMGSVGEGMFGKWKALKGDDEITNPWIVWPPMVVVQNTKLELDEQEKWIGMGNRELLDLFKDYNVMKARHAYGPQGHRGMSIVVFADSPAGYMDAQRLEKHFKDSRRGRENWDNPGKIIFHPGGNRVLYGFMATAEDMEIFNKHSGKSKLKWSLRRLHEAVIEPMRKMDEENLQLNWLKRKVQKQKEHTKTLEKTVSLVARKLRLRDEEIEVIRQRALEQHEENQREMDFLEQAYKERINQLSSNSARQEEELRRKEDLYKQERIQRCQQLEKKCAEISTNKNLEGQQWQQKAKVEEEIAWQSELVEMVIKDAEDYESHKEKLVQNHHTRKMNFMREQYEIALKFEEELEKEKTELLEKYRKQRDAQGNLS